jgi:uncharacterized protein
MNSKKDLLVVFYRNPELGKVKTRLAASIGNEKALSVYIQLSKHTFEITKDLAIDKIVFYSHFVDESDFWSHYFTKKVQQGLTLGEKMLNAFRYGFEQDYAKVCIIGTDCLELTSDIVQKSFDALNDHEAVLGPAKDGGYYLLGMNRLWESVFERKQWSTHTVAHDTIKDFITLRINYHLLPLLSDVDVEDDLKGKLLN